MLQGFVFGLGAMLGVVATTLVFIVGIIAALVSVDWYRERRNAYRKLGLFHHSTGIFPGSRARYVTVIRQLHQWREADGTPVDRGIRQRVSEDGIT